ncbi:MAG TPA: hypothetical protein VK465_01145 [Fibrobacteria bacterium]|nr:hypothetical protein [Fibrobacteria bacterium]
MSFSNAPFRPRKLSRPVPDTTPPMNFGIPAIKLKAIPDGTPILRHPALKNLINKNRDWCDTIQSRHPNFNSYTPAQQQRAMLDLLYHPKFQVKYAELRNQILSIPSRATSSRQMTPGEQTFLTNAFRMLDDEFKHMPFRIHGETAVLGKADGCLTKMVYNPKQSVKFRVSQGERYSVHTHPPFMEPFTSSASEGDHRAAAKVYGLFDNRMDSYVTNGKDVLHYPPATTELVKLTPDPKMEEKLGKFPTAYKVPTPEQPPHPFTHHEAPPAFKPWDPKR